MARYKIFSKYTLRQRKHQIFFFLYVAVSALLDRQCEHSLLF